MVNQILKRRNRNEFIITETELKLMAAAAIKGAIADVRKL